MDTCHLHTTLPVIVAGIFFLVAVLWLDGYRMRFAQDYSATGSAKAEKGDWWLNVIVALFGLGAAAALVLTSSCSEHFF
jgi:hypothetical protein